MAIDYTDEEYAQFGVLTDLYGIVYERATGVIKQNSIWTFDQPMIARFSTFSGPGITPTYGAEHYQLSWALAQESRWEQLKGDWVRITTTYAGAPNPGVLINSASSQTRTEPIAASPKFQDILNYLTFQPGISATGGVSYDTDSYGAAVFKGFDKTSGRYQGVESYDEPGVLHSVSYASYNHSDRWAKLYKIDTPKGDPPDVPTGVNWRLADITESQKGYVYDIKETWESSGPNGWDPVVYGTDVYPNPASSGSGGSGGSGAFSGAIAGGGSGSNLIGDTSSSGSSSIGNLLSSSGGYSNGDPLGGNVGYSSDSLMGSGDPLGGDGYDSDF